MTSPTEAVTPFRAGRVPGAVQPMAVPAFTGPHVLLADCSEFQASIADAIYLEWSKAIVIRCLYGTTHQDRAWYGGQRRDLLHAGGARFLGCYQYLVAGQSGAAQAQAFHDLVGPIRPGEVFIADFEEGAKPELSAWYSKMLALYGQAIRPYLWTYTGLYFGEAQSVLPVEWIAAYGQSEPSTPHRLWQFTSAFQVPGVGLADCSVWHGSLDQLAALAYPAAKPGPPADWTYGAPVSLHATGGHTSVRLEWRPPAGAPEPPDHYVVYVYEGTVCNSGTLVATYPRNAHGLSWEGGGLKRGGQYTAHVVASGPGTGRIRPFTYASAQFRTA